MPVVKLTDLTIQNLKIGLHYDAKTPGFGVRVGTNRRTFFVVRGAARTQTTIGHYPLVSLAEARRRALLALGTPLEKKATITFPDARRDFLALDRWRPRTKRVLKSTLRRFIWSGPVRQISQEQIIDALDAIPGESARWHARKDLATLFHWLVPKYLDRSPMEGIKAEKQRARDRVLDDEELKAVWRAASDMGYPFGNVVQLLILTGQRCGEIGHLRSENLRADRFYVPPSVAKNGREHWVPLSDFDRTLLPQRKGFLFPNATGDAFSAFAFNHKVLLKLSGTQGWTLHDLRRTFATGLARLGTPIHVTEKILNHVSGSVSGVAAIYNRYDYWDERVAALAAWEKHVLQLVSTPSGAPTGSSEEVTPNEYSGS